MNLDKLDRIELSMSDVDKIRKWHEYHYDELKAKGEINFPLEEGLIVIREKLLDVVPYDEMVVHFKIEEPFKVSFELYIQSTDNKDETPTLSWVLDESFFENQKFEWQSGFKNFALPEEMAQQQAKFHAMITFEVFTYMVNVAENVIESKQTRVYNKKAKSKKGGNNKKRKVKLSVTRYSIDFERSESTRKNERHTLGWNVRGHWRYYKKSGKRVWIKGYAKGDKESIEGKTYKV